MKKQPDSQKPGKTTDPKLAPKERIDKDPDDLVHEQNTEPAVSGEEDPDDIIHQPQKPATGTVITEESMEDPDDLVHGFTDEEEE